MQRKRHSFIESITNVLIGYLIAVGSQILIFPIFNIHIPLKDNFLIGMYFTVISIVRSYTIRRWLLIRNIRSTVRLSESESIRLRPKLPGRNTKNPGSGSGRNFTWPGRGRSSGAWAPSRWSTAVEYLGRRKKHMTTCIEKEIDLDSISLSE